MAAAEVILESLRIYVIAGAVIGVIFLSIGIDRIESQARGFYLFRILLIPGVIGLWPLVVWRWIQLRYRAQEKSPHET